MAGSRREKALLQHQQQIALEKRFTSKLQVLIDEISKDITAVYASTGQSIDAAAFTPELERLLYEQYMRVSGVFGKSLSEDISEGKLAEIIAAIAAANGNTVADEIARFEKARDEGIDLFIDETVPVRAEMITQTNNSAITAAILSAQTNQNSTQDEVAEDAGRNFKAANTYRANMISATETQTAAEGSKFIEASIFSAGMAAVSSAQMQKEWETMGDDEVRDAHVAAQGQIRKISEPFEVGGEQMPVPADGSLGATAGNIINCRCSAVYFVE